MAELVAITDPDSGRTYRVHPWIAEQGEWFAQDKAAFRAQLPGIEAFERDYVRRLAATPAAAALHPHATPVSGDRGAKAAHGR